MGSARTLTLKEVQELFPDRVLLYIKKGEKGPFVSEWQKTTFDKTQTAWYRNQLKSYPNTGVLLGHRLVALDFDTNQDVEQFFADNPQLRDNTLVTRGARGAQIWLVMADDDYPGRVVTVKGKGECRGALQSVVRGIHPYGHPYTCLCDKAPATIAFKDLQLPDWMAEEIAKDEQKIKLNGDHKAPTVGLVSIDPLRDKRIRAYLDKVDIAVDGQGGSTPMFRTACFLANRCGLSRDDARVYLKYYSETRSDPPWSDKEIEQKLDDAYGPEHYNPIGDFWKQPKNQGVTNNAPGRKETFSEQLEREFNGHQAPQPLPYEPGCDDGSLSMPQIRLPALNRPESQFAAEVGQLLGQRQVLFRLDDRLVEVEQEQFDGELDQFKLARGGLKFRTLTATRAKTWLEQFVQTGIDSKSEDGDGANIFKAKTMSEALARSLLESPQFLKSIPRVARILDVAIPVRTKTGEYVFPKPGFNRELGLFVALDAPPFTKMSCPEAIAVLEKAHAGFCWKNEQSKVHAYARILTPFARGLMGFGERPPLWFFGGNRPRCGGPRTLCGCLGSENFGLERMECWFFCIDGCLLPQAERVTCSLTIVV